MSICGLSSCRDALTVSAQVYWRSPSSPGSPSGSTRSTTGSPLDQWPTTDWIVGALLAICAAVAVIGAQRIIESRAQVRELARRTGAIADAAWVVARGGHMGAVLDRVAEEACHVTGADRATICALDRQDPRISDGRRGAPAPRS